MVWICFRNWGKVSRWLQSLRMSGRSFLFRPVMLLVRSISCPFGVAEIGGEDEHDFATLFDGVFESENPVVAPFDVFFVKETVDSVAFETPMEFADEWFV